MRVSFVVPGEPVSRQAHTISGKNGFVRKYLPKESENFQERVRAYGCEAMNGQPPMSGHLSMDVLFVFTAPDSGFKTKIMKQALDTGAVLRYPKIRQDIDNLLKNLGDGLKGVVVVDDKYISDVIARKRVARIPRTEVTIVCED